MKILVRLCVFPLWVLCIFSGDLSEWAEEKFYAVMEWSIEP